MNISFDKFNSFSKLINDFNKCIDFIVIKNGILSQRLNNGSGLIRCNFIENNLFDENVSFILEDQKAIKKFINRVKIFDNLKEDEELKFFINDEQMLTVSDKSSYVTMRTTDFKIYKYSESIITEEKSNETYDQFFKSDYKLNIDFNKNISVFDRITHSIKYYEDPNINLEIDASGLCSISIQNRSSLPISSQKNDNSSVEEVRFKDILKTDVKEINNSSIAFNASFLQLPWESPVMDVSNLIFESEDSKEKTIVSLLIISGVVNGFITQLYQLGRGVFTS